MTEGHKKEYKSPHIERIEMDFEISLSLESPTADPELWGKQNENQSSNVFKDDLA